MLVGQQLGPFLIDKELGSGAMGAVYRGKYLKTGQVVAVKVMAPGVGSTNASAASRFEREANILKQLNHPNIVRLFGVGKTKGMRYYAMEYVKGESLDRVMSRRGRMTWEEVIDLGLQLCSALQHAHEAGIVHRDLKPSNLMILEDGTLKLTDFGIAKDLDVTQLTGLNCTVGTAAYMSPEQCRGEKDLTFKSDLYSLGVVFYELITGRKPFVSENSMEMFLHHVHTVPERPSRLALEIPVWLDNLICQLLEKKPEHRPVDAAMVSKVLSTIQEKVEAQQSAGVDAVTARRGDRPRAERLTITDEEREVARSLRGKKAKRAKKKPIQQQAWPKALGLCAALGLLITGLVFAVRPPSAEALYAEAERLMKAEDPEKHDLAREGPIRKYLIRYGDKEDGKTEQVRKWAEDYDAARYEKLIDRHLRHRREGKGLAVEAQTTAEADAFKAAGAEADGDLDKAMKLWQKVLKEEGAVGVGIVAKRHLALLAAIDGELKQLEALRARARNEREEPALEGPRRKAFNAYRQERLGDRLGARASYDRLYQEALKDPAGRFWQLLAAAKRREMQESLQEKKQDKEARLELIRQSVEDAKAAFKLPGAVLLDLRLLAQEVALLYEGDEELAKSVEDAKKLVKEIDQRLRDASKADG
jgi:serine/threonine-protein kinase